MALKKKMNPDERNVRARARPKSQHFLCAVPCSKARGSSGRARSGDGKPNAGAHQKHAQDRGAVRVRVARACDEKRCQDYGMGEGVGCGRETRLAPGSPGRCAFDISDVCSGVRA